MILTLLLMAAAPASTTYVIAIGNNAVPLQAAEASLETLAFSDDDALSFAELAQHFSPDITVLTEADTETQRRYPALLERARSPSLVELERAVERIAIRISNTQDAEAIVLLFFSGHGSVSANGEAFLALTDASLTREYLYERVLSKLDKARAVHLLVDACNAESVVRPRGRVKEIEGQPRKFSASELQQNSASLLRFANVGAIIATSSGRAAHEWTRYERGVFTHELLSGMRGAADVNGDLRIEYSELNAFFGAANREIGDPKARLEVLTHPPRSQVRAALIDLRRFKNVAWIDGDAADAWGHFFLEDGRGVRVADAHAERSARLRIAVPADAPLFVQRHGREAMIIPHAGETIRASDVRFSETSTRSRGAVAHELERGLFAAPFGPTYYKGFVDARGDAAVTFDLNKEQAKVRSKAPAIALWASAGAATVAAAVFGGLALAAQDAFQATNLQVPAQQQRERFNAMSIGFYASIATAAAAAGVGFAVYPWVTPARDGATVSVGGSF